MPESLWLLLLVLACPVGMGLVMWYMMRGDQPRGPSKPSAQDVELTRLRAEVDQLRAAQRETARHDAAGPDGAR